MFTEDKQAIMDKLCEALQLTSNAGDPAGNRLERLQYIRIPGKEVVRPIFADGDGMDGYNDICVTMDSGTAMIVDVIKQFVSKVW